MIEIGYNLSPSWSRETAKLDLAHANEMTLRYDVFLGDVIIRIGTADFSARWGWIPILDFAASLSHAVEELATHRQPTVLAFTESGHELRFIPREGDQVRVLATYTDDSAEVLLEDLRSCVRAFSSQVLLEIFAQYPDLKLNEHLWQWYPV